MTRRRLLFIGDSLIEFFDWAARFPQHDVLNMGSAGETVEGLAARLDRVISRTGTADSVFIMSGINNMAMGDAGFAAAYRGVVSALKSAWPNAAIHVQSLLPVLFPFVANEDIRAVNAQLKSLADDAAVRYLDVHAAFLDSSGEPLAALLLDDGVHLSGEGYRVWSAEVEKALDRPGVSE